MSREVHILQISAPIPILRAGTMGPKRTTTIPLTPAQAQFADRRRIIPAPEDTRGPPSSSTFRAPVRTIQPPERQSSLPSYQPIKCPYDLDLIRKFITMCLVDANQDPQQPPLPVSPRKTKQLQEVYIELPDNLKSVSSTNLPLSAQPLRKAYFLHWHDFYMKDFSVEFIHRRVTVNRLYPAVTTIFDISAQEYLQQQADSIAGIQRHTCYDYRNMAQVLTHSEWCGFEFTNLKHITSARRRIRFEYIRTASGREYWSLPINIDTNPMQPGEPAKYSPFLSPKTAAVPTPTVQDISHDGYEDQSTQHGMDAAEPDDQSMADLFSTSQHHY